jgi:hypothetical protein
MTPETSQRNYRALLVVSKMVTGLPEIQVDHDGICKGCALGKMSREASPAVIADPRESWISYTRMYVDR